MKKYIWVCICLLITTLLGARGVREPMPLESKKVEPSRPNPLLFTESVQSFSDQLFFVENLGGKNAMISPLSVLLALGMSANGASGTTLSSMLDVLVSGEGGLIEFNAANEHYINGIKDIEDVELSIANSLWLTKEITFDQEFLSKTEKAYHAGAKPLDFSAKSSLVTINSWVSDATRGTITSIIDSLDPAALVYLINAVYFKGDWMTPFTKESTYDQDFFLEESIVQTPFMHQKTRLPYAKTMDAQMLMMPYTNSRFALVAILPPESTDLSSWLASQKEEGAFTQRLFASVDHLTNTRMDLSFPKFEASYKDSLVTELKLLGMRDPFDSAKADFSLMTESRSKNLFIDEVLHKTFIRVDEKGSEAAAVTSVMIKMTSMPMPEELTLSFNRPFFYAIIDREARIPLFMGTIKNPLAE